jgi:hypothetical protein
MNPEQKLGHNVQEKIITNESVQEVAPVEAISEEDKQANAEKKVQAEIQNNEEIAKKREEIMNQMGGQESKEGYSEGHIMNPQMLDKIAQLEAIDTTTGEFNQERYDDYINGQAKLGVYTVGENQKKLQKKIDAGKKIKDYYNTEVIYGQGGWNRYPVDLNSGEVFLSRGASNTTGSPEYKAKLAQKAKELGIKVEGE